MKEFAEAYVATLHSIGKPLGEYMALLTVMGVFVVVCTAFVSALYVLSQWRKAAGK